MMTSRPSYRNPFLWVPTLYLAEGLPYVMVMTVSVTMYKRLGISNADIAFFTSLLYFPWFLKFAWSPFVDMFRTKRYWTVSMQLMISIAVFGIALGLPTTMFWNLTLLVFALMAISSATHDIAADGFYMLGLDQQQQAAFVGVRSMFYRIATIVGSGLLVVLAGELEPRMGNQVAWSTVFVVAGVLFVFLFAYHRFVLPYPETDKGAMEGKRVSGSQIWTLLLGFLAAAAVCGLTFYALRNGLLAIGMTDIWSTITATISLVLLAVVLFRTWVAGWVESHETDQESLGPLVEFLRAFVIFMKKKEIWTILGFLLFYRFAEAQLVKLVQPFLLDPREQGGLGLSTKEVGIVYGTVGIAALTLGGLLGGYLLSKKGLKWWLWPMVLIMHLPDLMFVYLSQVQPTDFVLINIAVATEQFGYGFGFTAYMMFMIMISQGEHKTAHYAICTGIMALGMMLPGMFSGALQEMIGYRDFFLWVMISTVPGFVVAALVTIDPEFGKKSSVGKT